MTVKQSDSRRPSIFRGVIVCLLAFILMMILIGKAWLGSRKSSTFSVPELADTVNGKKLAARYCQGCHILPQPHELRKAYWEKVLPSMGLRLGIHHHKGISYDDYALPGDLHFFPPEPMVSADEWEAIRAYYIQQSPSVQPVQKRSLSITRTLPGFVLHRAPNFLSHPTMFVSMVKIDTTVYPARIFVFDAHRNMLYLLSHTLAVLDSLETPGKIVDLSITHQEILACSIGKKLSVSEDSIREGEIVRLTISKQGKITMGTSLFKNLARPVQVVPCNLNNDTYTDYLICEFGNLQGSLTWMEGTAHGEYRRHVISNSPGCVKAIVRKDEKQNHTIWALFAQGDERLIQFTWNGNQRFSSKQILRFPALNGSTSFDLADFNQDGHEDILYSCGDNGDLTPILKPYHGVYIFLNDSLGGFKQDFFFPINGCYRAFAQDFDDNGTVDIAASALYTDSKQPEEGFVLLINMGYRRFKAHALPANVAFERTLTMDAGDYNGDGHTDLILGSAFSVSGPFGYQKQEPCFIVLQNVIETDVTP